MQIKNWALQQTDETIQVSADVDDFRVWYKVPESYPVSKTGDPFLAIALLPAMVKGEDLEIEEGLTISPRLFKGLHRIQEIHNCWNPNLRKIQISAASIAPPKPIRPNGTLCFFSSGVDSTYTFLKQARNITHLAYIYGFDFFEKDDAYHKTLQRIDQFAKDFGKTLIPIETNHYPFGYRYNLSRNLTQGSCLGSVALLLGFPEVYIAASYSYKQLFPLGSHPLLDSLWANECLEITHDGCEASRTDKLRRIGQNQSALANLRVCFNDPNENCGSCLKCIRTMISLKLLGLPSGPFPPLPSSKVLSGNRIAGDIEMAFFRENVELALKTADKQLRKALRLVCVSMKENSF